MKIREIFIRNFRSIEDEVIKFPANGILALVGPNNAGKSNILRAVDNLLGDSWFSGDKAELNDHYMKDRNNTIEICINFDDDKKVKFNSAEKWPEYLDSSNKKINDWNIPTGSKGNVKADFPCTYLSANRDLAKNMQFRSYELMGKITKSFNDRIHDDTKLSLKTKFEEIMRELDKVEGFSDFKNDFSKFFNELQSDSPYRLKVDFKAFSPINYFKTINILANDSSVNDEFDIDPVELGEGNKSLMLFALIRSYAKNFKKDAVGILAIEEPEIYLHPQARRHLYKVFQEIVSNSNVQIIYTTHSPDFLSTEDFSSIGLVSKDGVEGTKVKIVTEQELVSFSKKTGVPENKTNTNNIKEFYATTSNFRLNEAFFAKHLILVEGETEELCLPLLLERLGLNYYSSGISIIGVNGKNQVPKYWRLFHSFGINISVVIDSDFKDNENKNNIESCFRLKIDTSSINKIKKYVIPPRQNLFVFEKDFETALKKDFDNDDYWSRYEAEAKEFIKPTKTAQKGQIARYIVKRILKDHPEYKPSLVKGLLEDIQSQSYDPVDEDMEIPF
jgi:putative ATP-dependent endonuclease of OLD family